MNLSELKTARSPAVRVMLVAEVVLYVAGLCAYVWFFMPSKLRDVQVHQWYQAVFIVLAAGLPIGLNLLHGDRPRDSGLRTDTFAPAARLAGVATALMACGILLTAWAFDGWRWVSWNRLGGVCLQYLVWGVAQQYLLQAFALRRLCQAGLPTGLAVALAAGLFGLLHAPNWTLVACTGGAGVVWCAIFLRRPNLFVLGLAHAILAVLLYHCWNWLAGLTIGPAYLIRVGNG